MCKPENFQWERITALNNNIVFDNVKFEYVKIVFGSDGMAKIFGDHIWLKRIYKIQGQSDDDKEEIGTCG